MINNIVLFTDLQCDINLTELTLRCTNIVYHPKTFSGAQWKSKTIGGHCMLFSNGKMVINGRAKNIQEAKQRLRRYTRILQKMGWNVKLKRIYVKTISASFKVEGPLRVSHIVNHYRGTYEPEQFLAVMFVKDSIHFTCFQSGSVLMTGIKTEKQVFDICMPILIELPLL